MQNSSLVVSKYNNLPAEITRQSRTKKDWQKILKEFTASQDGVRMSLKSFIEDKVLSAQRAEKNRHDKAISYASAVETILPNVKDKYALTVYPDATLLTGSDATFLQKISREAKKCIDAKKDATRKVSLFVRREDGTFRQVIGGNIFNPKSLHVNDLVEIEKLVLVDL